MAGVVAVAEVAVGGPRGPEPTWARVRRVCTLAGVRPLPVAGLAAIGIAGAGLSAVGTYLARYVFNALAARDLRALGLWTLWAFALFALSSGLKLWRAGLIERLGKRWIAQLRRAVMVHILSQDLAAIQRRHSGEIASLVTQDVAQIQDLSEKVVLWTIFDSVRVIISLACIAKLSLPLFCFTALTAPLYALTNRRVQHRALAINRRLATIRTTIATDLTERVAGFATALAFNQQGRFVREMEATNTAYLVEEMRGDVLKRWVDFQNTLLQGTLGYIAPLFGLALLPRFDVGMAVAFLGLFAQVTTPLRSLLGLPVAAAGCAVALDRVLAVLDQTPTVTDHPQSRAVQLRGAVRFRDVSFAYDPQVPVLRGIGFALEPGQSVAVVGSTGAGKSTIAALLARHRDRGGGEILLDGIPIERIALSSLRAQIAVVEQAPTIFRDSIANNIRFGRPEASDAEVHEAAVRACIAEEILRLPDGYGTRLGERGTNLSGGQRQRVAIARLQLIRPAIVILDEATSALDVGTEELVQEALERLCAGRTTLIIAHRLSTVWRCDRILVLQDGAIAEAGTHAELVAKGGLYAAMVRTSAAATRAQATG